MRVAVIILSLVASDVLFEMAGLSMRLGVFIGSGARQHEAMGSVVVFVLWTGAIALVYPYPGSACWLFALAAGAAFYDGLSYGIDQFIVWGWLAIGLAALTRLALSEKQRADQAEWTRTQHELAVHAALRSLHETVPELLTRVSVADKHGSVPSALVELRPAPPTVREIVRR